MCVRAALDGSSALNPPEQAQSREEEQEEEEAGGAAGAPQDFVQRVVVMHGSKTRNLTDPIPSRRHTHAQAQAHKHTTHEDHASQSISDCPYAQAKSDHSELRPPTNQPTGWRSATQHRVDRGVFQASAN